MATPESAKESQILLGAAEVIERYGWVQHYFGSVHSGFCASGAMWHAREELGFSNHIVFPAVRLADSLAIISVTDWNDSPYRTKDEVITALRKAANDVASV